MTRLLRALVRLDDHWIGDFLGAVCLFGIGYGAMLIGYAVGLK